MKPEETSKQKDVLRQISEASDAIRRKHKMLKLGKDSAEKAMGEMFKPIVTPLQSLVESSKQKIKQEVKEEIKEEVKQKDNSTLNNKTEFDDTSHYDSSISDDDVSSRTLNKTQMNPSASSTPAKPGSLVKSYLAKVYRKSKEINLRYGVRRRYNDFYIGDSEINFEENTFYVKDHEYLITPGLLELLFKKSPNYASVTQDDQNTYLEIIKNTNTYRKNYKSDGSIYEDSTIKFNTYIANFLTKTSKGKRLPKYKIVKKKKTQMDYVHWDNPNELVDRLRLLMASQAAGNPSHINEIISIIEELREAGIIY
ncbi:uncharacterized protein LOC130676317 [Microplitis mediator]|uniref:uncharacterized protein LOC130676317 n=1 Tax=Microplitis mediator TaxID=375433 RepID=UPI0025553B6B|nr:uncharacterized protein LOC130676317 [Microplitis mediator]